VAPAGVHRGVSAAGGRLARTRSGGEEESLPVEGGTHDSPRIDKYDYSVNVDTARTAILFNR
jgi:hypothetical protein